MSPARFGRYEVLCQIGDGAMGRVYRAWDPLMSRVVAVKAVKSEYLTHQTATDYLRRFRREAQAAGSLSHPSIVSVFDVGFDFLVMEHVEGPTLKDLMAARGRLDPREVAGLLAPIADAIDTAHRAGVIHRDIKPANIMVQCDGTPKLMDFGIAHIDSSVMTTAGEILGSPSYMSPEQIAGFEVTGATDVYALAVVAYEMLTGQPPFLGALTQVIYKVMHEAAPPPRQWNAGLPPRYDQLFERALSKDALRRYATASELVGALELRGLEDELAALGDDVRPGVAAAEAQGPAAGSSPTPTASGSGRGFYAHVETVISRPGRLALRPAAPISRRSSFAALALVALAAGSSALLVHPPEPVAVLAAPAGAPVVRPATPTTLAASSRPTPAASPAARRSAPLRPEPLRVATSAVRTAPAGPSAPLLLPVSLDPAQLVAAGLTPPRKLAGRTVFPEARRGARLNGTVTISLVVDENGLPSDLAVVESAGEALDAAALESVRSWRFAPAQKDGAAVAVRWLARQTYQLAR